MIKILGTPSYPLTTSQSEEIHAPYNPHPNVAFKSPSSKARREYGSFKHELPILLAWYPVMNAVCAFLPHNPASVVGWLFCSAGKQTQVLSRTSPEQRRVHILCCLKEKIVHLRPQTHWQLSLGSRQGWENIIINEIIYHNVLDLRDFSQLERRTFRKLDPKIFSNRC